MTFNNFKRSRHGGGGSRVKTETPGPESIRTMFDALARRYDWFNRLTSLGMDGAWRRTALEAVRPGMRVLDVGCGTGDLCLGAVRRLQGRGEVTGLDFSERMLDVASARVSRELPAETAGLVKFTRASAEDLPLDGRPYDLIVSAFVLRNLYDRIDAILLGMFRSLRPGGSVRLLDLTEPPHPILAAAWRAYLATAVRAYGRLLFGDAYPPDYLTRSARRFPSREAFVERLRKAGFSDARARNLCLGAAVLYEARRPGA